MKNKIKFGILILIFSSYSYGECTKSEVIKLIDKGFSKTKITSICELSNEKEDKWITPKNSICRSKRGKIEKGICTTTFKNAKSICETSGGRLPTIKELKKLVTDCGGAINALTANEEDPNYQACYKRKGFSDTGYYWSSSQLSDKYWVHTMFILDGGLANSRKSYNNGKVQCVKDKE